MTHRDPFADICIHGVEGATFKRGRRLSAGCENCYPRPRARKCGHAFVLTEMCMECKRYYDEVEEYASR